MTSDASYDLNDAIDLFFTESRESLDGMETALLDLEKKGEDRETVNTVFRAAHTIKGSAGMFNFAAMEQFTHVVESVLDSVRNGSLSITADMIAVLLQCRDHLLMLLDFFDSHRDAPEPDEALRREGERLTRLLSGVGQTAAPSSPAPGAPGCWHISLRLDEDVFRNGLDPRSFIAYLEKLGSIETISPVFDKTPALADLNPESCYLGFEIDFRSDATREAIEEVFSFLKEDSTLVLIPPADTGTARAEQPHHDAAEPKGKSAEDAARKSIRVDTGKLDNQINLIGELVITMAQVGQTAAKSGNTDLLEAVSHMSLLVEDIRDNAMDIRMVPIGDSFKRFERAVRDLGVEQGKEIEFITRGGDTELDKTIIEKVIDPIMHLVRNAVDHGIDTPARRVARGKPARGIITLRTYRTTGSVVIEVTDDGDGLDRERIIAKAIEKGLLAAEEAPLLSDNDAYQFVFYPGFSTSEEVTRISGRGVGLDVVKKNIEAMRGSVDLESVAGKGTSVSIYLPFTLAIIDGFLMEVGASTYVVPLSMVYECIKVPREELRRNESGNYINLRGAIVPYISLRGFFGCGDCGEEEGPEADIVIVGFGMKKAGFIVDKPLGEFQTVIKPLSVLFSDVLWINGATILGDGSVALILDVGWLLQYVQAVSARSIGMRSAASGAPALQQ